MKKLLITAFFIFTAAIANCQFSFTYNGQEYNVLKSSVFKDSAGKSYNYNEAMLVMMGGAYEILPANPRDASKGFLLSGISKEERLKRAIAAPKPAETTAFKTGKKFDAFSAYDMNGNLVDTKQLKGKVLVINFWFTTCPPCKAERPYLNQIVDDYKTDPNVVFIAVALDQKEQLSPYLKEHEFKYTVLPDGKKIADSYGIPGYPTQLIVDKEGKIAFHTLSYYYVTDYWMRKTIDELRGR
ncbi:MAG: TlpA family protein disulfide reductase [Chitinophagaceae bacterium]|nr:TlpA family protein disulfide reductase [Chitinophagaceae bacterium]MBK9569986.1 TlpA family protein disulfide reductase [Chitinophagaceae bacterium]MBL0130903.1 TlpA family protein disulfide reductase [Chitinophagaceae bacterium]MBL0272797.1 TlpA family protein disulfide reductase [Chitinophagaceae bacterium]